MPYFCVKCKVEVDRGHLLCESCKTQAYIDDHPKKWQYVKKEYEIEEQIQESTDIK